jgi:hypothetical protein
MRDYTGPERVERQEDAVRGTGLDQELVQGYEQVEETGDELVQVLREVTADHVVTEAELVRVALAVASHDAAIDRQLHVIGEAAGTLRLISTAANAGISSAWLERRAGEHIRDMSRTVPVMAGAHD